MDSDNEPKPKGWRRRIKGSKAVFNSIGEALNIVVAGSQEANVFSDLLSSKARANHGSSAGRQIPEKLQTLATPGEAFAAPKKMIPGRVRDGHNSNAQQRLRAAIFQEQTSSTQQGSPLKQISSRRIDV